MTQDIRRVARERIASLERESSALTGEAEGFLLFAHENCGIVDFLSFLWSVWLYDLRVGGAPAKLFLEECDLILSLARAPEGFLNDISKVWQQRPLPKEFADPIYADVKSARERLGGLVGDVRAARERAAKRSEVSADPEELKRRVQQADERQEWLLLGDVITQMGQSTRSKQD